MTPEDLKLNVTAIYGKSRGAQAQLARDLGIFPSTVRRWMSGAIPIPGPAAAYVKLRMQHEVLLMERTTR